MINAVIHNLSLVKCHKNKKGLTHVLNVSSNQSFDTVVDAQNGVAAVDAIAHERTHGRVHSATRRTDMHHGHCVAFLENGRNSKRNKTQTGSVKLKQ